MSHDTFHFWLVSHYLSRPSGRHFADATLFIISVTTMLSVFKVEKGHDLRVKYGPSVWKTGKDSTL